MDLLNPSTTEGALTIGIVAGLISGAIIGFFSGKTYERRTIKKTKIGQKGNGNIAINDSNVGRDVGVRENKNKPRGRRKSYYS